MKKIIIMLLIFTLSGCSFIKDLFDDEVNPPPVVNPPIVTPTPPSTPPVALNPECSGVMDDDGAHGTKWKPRSDKDGKPAFLVSTKFQKQFQGISVAGHQMTFSKWGEWDSKFNHIDRVIKASQYQDVPDIDCNASWPNKKHHDNDHWSGCKNAPHRQVWRLNIACEDLPSAARIIAIDGEQTCVWTLRGNPCSSYQ